ncbi:MAG: acylphosphatase [Puniceicoccaceae bacterium]
MKVYHKRVQFRGHVQGVGFRYQTLDVARGFDVAGFVRNEDDGSVTLEVEGELKEVHEFIDAVVDELRSYIRESDESSEHREPIFQGFRIA